jgi:hypothetical protein
VDLAKAGAGVGGELLGDGAGIFGRLRKELGPQVVKPGDDVAWIGGTAFAADREAVLAFLQKQGFKDSEIMRQPTRTIDKLAREYGQQQGTERFRYVVTSSIIVRTPNIDQVQKSLGSTEELLKAGVVLGADLGMGVL